jgi:hypothetical protein
MKPHVSIIGLILVPVVPTLFQDVTAKADKWGNNGTSGRIDPFTEIFEVSISLPTHTVPLDPALSSPSQLVFFMTARMATCHDMTKNDADFKKLTGLIWTLLAGATPTALILPWFPSPSRVKILWADLKVFLMLRNYVEARRHAEPTSDATDILIAEGKTTRDIVQVGFAPKVAI